MLYFFQKGGLNMTIIDKLMDVSTIYTQVSMVFPHFDRWGGSWEETYRQFLARDLETKTDCEHGLLMAELVNTLGDGHTDVSLSKGILDEVGYFPFPLRYAQGRYFWEGREVIAIDGIPLAELVQRAGRYAYCVEGFCPRLGYFLPFLLAGTQHVLQTSQGDIPFSMLSQRPAEKSGGGVTFANHGDVLQITIGDFLRPSAPEIRQALEAVSPGKVVLDIRGNIGGMTQNAADVAQLFLPGTFSGSRKWTRRMTGVEYASASQILCMGPKALKSLAAPPEEIVQAKAMGNLCAYQEYTDSWGREGTEPVFSGPLVLLISRETVSAAEDFVSFFRSNHRATLIGEPTCGTSGTPVLRTLSCGTLRVCSVGYRLLDGTWWLGRGIHPDTSAAPSPEDMSQGVDRVLKTALTFLS